MSATRAEQAERLGYGDGRANRPGRAWELYSGSKALRRAYRRGYMRGWREAMKAK